jgi:hypothetical protein
MPDPTADLRARIERAVGMHLRPGPECEPHPDEIAIVDSVMAALDERQRAYEDLLGDISLYVDWRYLTTKMTTEQKNLWADAHDAWAGRMGHEEPSRAERWWAE